MVSPMNIVNTMDRACDRWDSFKVNMTVSNYWKEIVAIFGTHNEEERFRKSNTNKMHWSQGKQRKAAVDLLDKFE